MGARMGGPPLGGAAPVSEIPPGDARGMAMPGASADEARDSPVVRGGRRGSLRGESVEGAGPDRPVCDGGACDMSRLPPVTVSVNWEAMWVAPDVLPRR